MKSKDGKCHIPPTFQDVIDDIINTSTNIKELVKPIVRVESEPVPNIGEALDELHRLERENANLRHKQILANLEQVSKQLDDIQRELIKNQ